MGMKIVEEYWTMGAYDAVVIVEAPDEETISAFILKVASLGKFMAKLCARFAGTRWKQSSRKSNRASERPKFALSAGDKIVDRR